MADSCCTVNQHKQRAGARDEQSRHVWCPTRRTPPRFHQFGHSSGQNLCGMRYSLTAVIIYIYVYIYCFFIIKALLIFLELNTKPKKKRRKINLVNSSVWLMATLSAVSKCSGLLHWGWGGIGGRSLGGSSGIKILVLQTRFGMVWTARENPTDNKSKKKKEATMEQNTDVEILILKQKR